MIFTAQVMLSLMLTRLSIEKIITQGETNFWELTLVLNIYNFLKNQEKQVC